MEEKRLTSFKNLSYCMLRLVAASLTTWLKVCRSRAQQRHLSGATTEAARGQLYSKASSPKTSPGSQIFTIDELLALRVTFLDHIQAITVISFFDNTISF